MLPIVASLLSSGLSLLGGAVLEKGKDYVEKKLGVKLPDENAAIPPEKLAELRELEFRHEELLQQLAVRKIELSLEEFKAGLADTQGARIRETEIATSEHAPILNKIIAPVLAILVVVGGGCLLWFGAPDVRTAAAGLVSTVLGYYFGTSVGSRDKQAMIERLTK